jgi:Outer membrane protein beta-barrel domain
MKKIQLFLVSIITAISLSSPSVVSAKTLEKVQSQTTDLLISLEQSQADRQREAERILKEAERVRRENSNSGSSYSTPESRNLERRTNNEVDRLRSNFGNEQKLRESQERIERLRRERNRLDRNQQNYPTIIPVPIYIAPPEYSEFDNPEILVPNTVIQRSPDSPSNRPEVNPKRSFGASDPEFNPQRPDLGTASVSLGFRNGAINPAIGYRFSNTPISIEIGAVFNQDTLPAGTLNDFSVPSSLLQQFPTGFDNLGRRNLTPQIGADLLGHFKVAPNVSLYGGVGVYFQGQADITRSNITTDLFRQSSSTDVSLAVSGGADVRLGDSFRVGGGYHSLRGITAKIGIDF